MFWTLIDNAKSKGGTTDDFNTALINKLAILDAPEIFMFDEILDFYTVAADRNLIYSAAPLLIGKELSDDEF